MRTLTNYFFQVRKRNRPALAGARRPFTTPPSGFRFNSSCGIILICLHSKYLRRLLIFLHLEYPAPRAILVKRRETLVDL